MSSRCPQCQAESEFIASSDGRGVQCSSCGELFLSARNVVGPLSAAGESSDPEDDDADHASTVLQSASPLTVTVASDPPFQKAHRLVSGERFGDYLIEGEIARGGMGVVYRATQVSLNRPVALKMILSARLAGEEQVRRFRSEAEAAAKFDHAGIVPVHEVGQVGGQHYFSMGLVEGGSLSKLTTDGPLAPRRAAELVRSIAQAVQYAHSRNIVHRDLKPDNVLLDEDGQAKITDFGLAKDLGSEGSGMTASHAVMGTPSYMAPEQALGRTAEVGPLADVYALGGILYYLLTNRPPFKGASLPDTLRQVVEDEPTAPQKLNPQVDRNLQTIVLKCLHKDMNRRYSSAREVAEELERWLENRPILARPVSLRERAWLWCRRRPLAAGTAVTLLMAAIVISVVVDRNSQQLRAEGLVESLLDADVSRVPELIGQLAGTEQWSVALLQTAAEGEADSLEERRRQLHARLALVGDEPKHIEPLVESLLSGPWSYVVVIRDQLPVTESLTQQWWTALRDTSADKDRRLKAAMALATVQETADDWSDSDWQFVVDHLLASNPEFQPTIRAALRPRRDDFLSLVEQRFQDPSASEALQQSTTAALVDWAADESYRLTEAITWARPTQWPDLLAAWLPAHDSSDLDRLLALADQQPEESLSSNDRIILGKRRANAAIALALTGNLDGILSVMHVDDDPEALSQFAARCRGYGVELDAVLNCFDRVEPQRAGLSDAELKRANRALYGLLLSLGEYELEAVPSERREALIAQLADWYSEDPSSTIHGATGWLLRRWGQPELVQKVDQTPVNYAPGREWYTVEVRPANDGLGRAVEATQPLYFTFVVFEPGEYELGSPADESERDDDETQHRVRITRPFAVLNREVRRGEFELFGAPVGGYEIRSPTATHPMNSVSWFDSVRFTRWLAEQSGLSESDQCYPSAADLEPPLEEYPLNSGDQQPPRVPLNLAAGGFRLPTESEWEWACRGGTRTAYGFGSDTELLPRYGWFESNSGELTHVSGDSRPNLRGLSDMHGNVFEWCHDWSDGERSGDVLENPTGPPTGSIRVNRGGSWYYAAGFCRSSFRNRYFPLSRIYDLGFRLAAAPLSE